MSLTGLLLRGETWRPLTAASLMETGKLRTAPDAAKAGPGSPRFPPRLSFLTLFSTYRIPRRGSEKHSVAATGLAPRHMAASLASLDPASLGSQMGSTSPGLPSLPTAY